MPYLKIETNKKIDNAATGDILSKTSKFISQLLAKPEKWVMISIQSEIPMMYNGNKEPAAYLELKSIGLPKEKCQDLSAQLCKFIESEIGVVPERIYIEFSDLERSMFGWNSGTF
jgi:phenylpyruvate tautomerase